MLITKIYPALTDFRELTVLMFYRKTFVIANKGINKLGSRDYEFASVIGGIPLVAGPSERGSTNSNS